jgi:hypothetical protein
MAYKGLAVGATLESSAIQDLVTLVAGVASTKIGVKSVFVSVASAMTVTCWSGSAAPTKLWKAYLPTNGTFHVAAPQGSVLFETNAGEPLTVSTSVAAGSFVHVMYDTTH